MSTVSSASLDKYEDGDLFSILLRYGLFVGAIFQLVCICSSILIPSISPEASSVSGEGIEESRNDVPRRLHKLRKQEKKKRR